jgi:hypothetical protein
MKRFIVLFAATIIVVLSSCSGCAKSSGDRKPAFFTFRGKVLENGTIVPVRCYRHLATVYDLNDTVWVNLRTHMIDDISDSAMKVVLLDLAK